MLDMLKLLPCHGVLVSSHTTCRSPRGGGNDYEQRTIRRQPGEREAPADQLSIPLSERSMARSPLVVVRCNQVGHDGLCPRDQQCNDGFLLLPISLRHAFVLAQMLEPGRELERLDKAPGKRRVLIDRPARCAVATPFAF